MSRSSRSCAGNRGFTLLEVLVAVAVSAILLTALYATFFSVFRAGGTSSELLEARLRTGRFIDRFSRDVHGAYIEGKVGADLFVGEPKGMGSVVSFMSFTYPVIKKGTPASGLAGVSYSTTETADGLSVFREVWNPYVGEKARAEILKHVRSFEVEYYDGSSWVKAWDSTRVNKLPAAVRAKVEFTGGDVFEALARTMVTSVSN